MNKKKTGAIVLCLIIGWLADLIHGLAVGSAGPHCYGRPHGGPFGFHDCLQPAAGAS